MMSCPNCGMQTAESVCPNCGTVLDAAQNAMQNAQQNMNNAAQPQPTIVINNTNANTITPGMLKKEVKKLPALLLCIFLGYFGAHKFFEGKPGMGILYIFTGGLFVIGWIVDIITIACKPDPYYV